MHLIDGSCLRVRVFLSDGFDLLCGTARDASVELGDELGEVVSRVAAVSLQCRSLSPHVQQQQEHTENRQVITLQLYTSTPIRTPKTKLVYFLFNC